jgi:hypothetical protein
LVERFRVYWRVDSEGFDRNLVGERFRSETKMQVNEGVEAPYPEGRARRRMADRTVVVAGSVVEPAVDDRARAKGGDVDRQVRNVLRAIQSCRIVSKNQTGCETSRRRGQKLWAGRSPFEREKHQEEEGSLAMDGEGGDEL